MIEGIISSILATVFCSLCITLYKRYLKRNISSKEVIEQMNLEKMILQKLDKMGTPKCFRNALIFPEHILEKYKLPVGKLQDVREAVKLLCEKGYLGIPIEDKNYTPKRICLTPEGEEYLKKI